MFCGFMNGEFRQNIFELVHLDPLDLPAADYCNDMGQVKRSCHFLYLSWN